MSIKVRVSIIIIVTFVLGILIGAMLNRAMIQRRIDRALSRMHPYQIAAVLNQRLRPDQKQAQQIQKILDKYTSVLTQTREDFLEETDKAMAALEAELDPILSPKQKALLRERPFGPRGFSERARQFMSPLSNPKRISETMDWLDFKLDLTEVQQQQIREIILKAGKRRLSPWERNRDPEQRGQERIRRFQEMNEAIEQILDQEQKATFSEIKAEWEKLSNELQSPRFRRKPPFPFD